MTAPLRAALIGAGRIAELHAIAIRAAGAEIVGVTSSTPDRTEDAAERLGIATSYDTVDALCKEPDVDVIHVLSPTGLHAAHAEQVLASGKHLICEKPIATTVADARRLVDLARANDVVAAVAFTYRFHPVVLEARRRVQGGAIGDLISIRGHYLQDWLLAADGSEWRLDSARGGNSRAWADIGSHLTDLVEFVSGDRLDAVAAITLASVPSPESASVSGDDSIAASFSMRSGAIGSLLVSQVVPGHQNSIEVELAGTRGSVTIDLDRSQELALGWLGDTTTLSGAGLAVAVKEAGFAPTGDLGDIVSAFTEFVRSAYMRIAGGSDDRVATLEDGLRAVTVTQSVLSAAAHRRWESTMRDGDRRSSALP